MAVIHFQKAVSRHLLAVTHSQMAVSHQSLVCRCLKSQSSLGQDCELLVLWSDQTCSGFRHQVQRVAGFLLQWGTLLNALAQGYCLVHPKILI